MTRGLYNQKAELSLATPSEHNDCLVIIPIKDLQGLRKESQSIPEDAVDEIAWVDVKENKEDLAKVRAD